METNKRELARKQKAGAVALAANVSRDYVRQLGFPPGHPLAKVLGLPDLSSVQEVAAALES